MKIDVLKEHLDIGIKKKSAAAVIEAAMFDAGLNDVRVSAWGSVVFEMTLRELNHRFSVSLPEAAYQFIRTFSAAEKKIPFSFSFNETLFETMNEAQIRMEKERKARDVAENT